MIPGLLAAALAVDLLLIGIAARAAGFSRVVGPLHIRLHDPSTLLLVAAFLCGTLVAVCWRTRARAWALLGAVAAVAIAGLAVSRSAGKMFPLGDIALIELYVRDAVSGRLLVGPYSRFGWHHPGPLYFYLLAPFYSLAGRTTAALGAGAAVVSIASIALLAWVAARSIGTRASAVILGGMVVYLWRVPELAGSPWNPHIVMLPIVLLVVAGAAAAGGDASLLPLLVALASFIVQTDVAMVPVVGVVLAAACMWAVAVAWPERKRCALRNLNASAWLAVVLWLPVVAEEASRTPGNLTLLWRFFVGEHGHGQAIVPAATAWAAMLASPLLPGFRLAGGGTFETGFPGVSFAIAIAQVAALGGVALWTRARDRAMSRLAIFALGASLIALWSATRIEDRIIDHEVFWMSALGALNLGIVAVVAFGGLREMLPRPRLRVLNLGAVAHGVLVGACAAICLGQANTARGGRLPVTATSSVVERLAGSVREYLEARHASKPLVQIGEDNWGLTAGVLLELDCGGIPFAVEESWMAMFPESFGADGTEHAGVAFGNSDEHAQRMTIPGSVPITSFSTTYVDGVPLARRSP